ncbi:B12-binding domain-containing radical SAM protein, partial [bacterium]|nr:B12-binding domain-containing radical SAM protein [candidate division CSSED10-310 bacterium]
IAAAIRAVSPDTPLIWGGMHPTLYPDSVKHPLCDGVVIGEGDATVVALARALAAGETLETVSGMGVKRDGGWGLTAFRPLCAMGELPWVDYGLIEAERYIYTWSLQELRMVRVIPVHAARGCPWHCTFCINTTINAERRYRFRDTDDILDEIEHLVAAYDLEMIILSDEEFFANRRRVEAFLDGIEARGLQRIRFNATCRVNHFRPGYIDAGFLKRLKACGFVNLVFGFESGSPDCLEIIRKEITVDHGLQAARLLASEGFMAVWGFIMAIPGETRRDLIKTLRVMEKIRRMSSDNYFIGPQIFRPYPGSELYRKAVTSGLNEPNDLAEWGSRSFTPEGWIGCDEQVWIRPSDRMMVDYVNTVAPVYYNHRYLSASGLKKIFHHLIRGVFRFRLETGFWLFPVEHRFRRLLEWNPLKRLRSR